MGLAYSCYIFRNFSLISILLRRVCVEDQHLVTLVDAPTQAKKDV